MTEKINSKDNFQALSTTLVARECYTIKELGHLEAEGTADSGMPHLHCHIILGSKPGGPTVIADEGEFFAAEFVILPLKLLENVLHKALDVRQTRGSSPRPLLLMLALNERHCHCEEATGIS